MAFCCLCIQSILYLSQDPIYVAFSFHVSFLVSSDSWHFISFSFLCFQGNSCEEQRSSILLECPLIWICLLFSHDFFLRGWIYHRGDMPLSPRHVRECVISSWLPLAHIKLDHLAEVITCLLDVSTERLLFLPLFTLLIRRESLSAVRTEVNKALLLEILLLW